MSEANDQMPGIRNGTEKYILVRDDYWRLCDNLDALDPDIVITSGIGIPIRDDSVKFELQGSNPRLTSAKDMILAAFPHARIIVIE